MIIEQHWEQRLVSEPVALEITSAPRTYVEGPSTTPVVSSVCGHFEMPKRARSSRATAANRMLECKSKDVAPGASRHHAVRGFRRVIKFMDNRKHQSYFPTSESDSDGVFSIVSDDDIACIFRCLLHIPSGVVGLSYFKLIEQSRKAVVALGLSCRRFAAVLRNVCPDIQAEALARTCTRVLPRMPFDDLAFTAQMRDELLSCDHVKMLQAAQNALVCHCAKACCQNMQRGFNKDIRKGHIFSRPTSPTLGTHAGDESRLVSVTDNCSLLAVSRCGNHAFAYARVRCSREHGENRGRRFRDLIQHFSLNKTTRSTSACTFVEPRFLKSGSLEIDCNDTSAPLQMRASCDGKSVVFVRALHAVDADAQTPFSSVWVWRLGWNRATELPRPRPESNISGDSMSAQDAWFRETNGETMLVVAWSTDFMHTSGHHVGSNAPPQSSSLYCFTSYIVDNMDTTDTTDTTDTAVEGRVEIYENMFDASIMLGTLLTCSPTADGNSVVTLVKRRDLLNGLRTVSKHCLDMGASYQIKSTYMNGPKGPISAVISPNGDCVVVVCKRDNSFLANFCWRTNHQNYTIIQSMDASPWMGLGPSDEPSVVANDLVKASVDLKFSPCGRFIALVDRHPLFGSAPKSHGVVIVDTAMRDKVSKFRPYPLFETEDQAPRSFHWTRQGIWLMAPGTDDNGSIGPRGGVLCLFAPFSNSFA